MSDTQTPLWPGMEGLEADANLHLAVGTLVAKLEQTRGIRDQFGGIDLPAAKIEWGCWSYRCKGIEDSIEALIKAARR